MFAIPPELSMEGENQQHKESKAQGSIVPSNRSKVIDVIELRKHH